MISINAQYFNYCHKKSNYCSQHLKNDNITVITVYHLNRTQSKGIKMLLTQLIGIKCCWHIQKAFKCCWHMQNIFNVVNKCLLEAGPAYLNDMFCLHEGSNSRNVYSLVQHKYKTIKYGKNSVRYQDNRISF